MYLSFTELHARTAVQRTTKREEERDHLFWAALLWLFHVNNTDSFLYDWGQELAEGFSTTRERTLFSGEDDFRSLNICSGLLTAGARDKIAAS